MPASLPRCHQTGTVKVPQQAPGCGSLVVAGVSARPVATDQDENGTNIFRPYLRPNLFREVLIRPYPSPDI
jgi:hypothetical protein